MNVYPLGLYVCVRRYTQTEEDINLNLNFYHSQAADYEIYKEKTIHHDQKLWILIKRPQWFQCLYFDSLSLEREKDMTE